jgi:hypothetical protein
LFGKLKAYNFPSTWEDTFKQVKKGGENLLIKDLKDGTKEWIEIETKFKETMPHSRVTQIQRIQNKRLWRTFSTEMEN